MLLWTCIKCGLRVPMDESAFPIRCKCGYVGKLEEAVELTEERKKQLPSTMRMAKNFAKATVRDVKHKFRRIGKEEYNRRLEVCVDCPTDHVILKGGKPYRCRHRSCGCFLKKKAWRESEKCPMGHWNEVQV